MASPPGLGLAVEPEILLAMAKLPRVTLGNFLMACSKPGSPPGCLRLPSTCDADSIGSWGEKQRARLIDVISDRTYEISSALCSDAVRRRRGVVAVHQADGTPSLGLAYQTRGSR